MVKIKLSRYGKKGQPHYRIIISEARSKRDGQYTEQIGYYNPRTNPSTIQIDEEKAKHWLSVGAQPTLTVKVLLIKAGILKKDIDAKSFKKEEKADSKELKTKAKKS